MRFRDRMAARRTARQMVREYQECHPDCTDDECCKQVHDEMQTLYGDLDIDWGELLKFIMALIALFKK